MTVAKRIENSRRHLAVGNEYSYRALMAADLRASGSAQTTNKILTALKEDGYEITDTSCPLVDSIYPTK